MLRQRDNRPSAPLKDQRWEIFAQNIAKGSTGREAYATAGFAVKTPESAGAAAARLLARVSVQRRVEYLKRLGAEKAGVQIALTQQRVLEELGKLALSNMLDYVAVGPDGDAYVSLKNLTREQAAAIQEITVEDFKDGRGDEARDVRRVRFKLADKRAALVDIGKHFGMFVDRKEVGQPGDFSRMDDETLREFVAERVGAAGLGHRGNGASRGNGGTSGKPH